MNRNILDLEIYKNLKKIFTFYKSKREEIGYQSYFEELLCKNFIKFLNKKGYCDAVNSGTSALYLACKVLLTNQKDELIISPCTNFGALSAAIYANYKKIHLCDSEPNSYQISIESLKSKINNNIKVIIITHIGGFSTNMKEIMKLKKKYPWIKIIEDCSQAIGTEYNGKKLGTFGDVSCFSTMYRKNLVTGGIGGLIFTKNKNLYNSIRSYSDRGKLFHLKKFNPKNPNHYGFPSLNFNLDEISSFIGYLNLKRVNNINKNRLSILNYLNFKLAKAEVSIFKLPSIGNYSQLSIYFLPIEIIGLSKENNKKIKQDIQKKIKYVNLYYHECLYLWKNFKKYLNFKKNDYSNISKYRDKTFNYLFHENTTKREINEFINLLIYLDKKFKKYCLESL